jgi:hypothetical protein
MRITFTLVVLAFALLGCGAAGPTAPRTPDSPSDLRVQTHWLPGSFYDTNPDGTYPLPRVRALEVQRDGDHVVITAQFESNPPPLGLYQGDRRRHGWIASFGLSATDGYPFVLINENGVRVVDTIDGVSTVVAQSSDVPELRGPMLRCSFLASMLTFTPERVSLSTISYPAAVGSVWITATDFVAPMAVER